MWDFLLSKYFFTAALHQFSITVVGVNFHTLDSSSGSRYTIFLLNTQISTIISYSRKMWVGPASSRQICHSTFQFGKHVAIRSRILSETYRLIKQHFTTGNYVLMDIPKTWDPLWRNLDVWYSPSVWKLGGFVVNLSTIEFASFFTQTKLKLNNIF